MTDRKTDRHMERPMVKVIASQKMGLEFLKMACK